MSSFTPLINQSNELLERKHYHIETIDYLLVSPADQKLFHISNKQILKNYSVSTSRFGLGNLMDSLKTPVGLHCIEEKINGGPPPSWLNIKLSKINIHIICTINVPRIAQIFIVPC